MRAPRLVGLVLVAALTAAGGVSVVVARRGSPDAATPSLPDASDAALAASAGRAPPELPDGSVSEDDVPTVRGVGAEIDAHRWFAARGVSEAALDSWYRAHFVKKRYEGPDGDLADANLGRPHRVLRVGDPPEDALYGEYDDEDVLHALTTGYVLVVRAHRPVAVLEVGVNVIYDDMDLARLLDLALAIAPDGLSAELTERAPEGTTLVAPAALRQSAEDARMDCQRELARDPSTTHGGGERTPLWMVDHTSAGAICKTVPLPGYPATLHGCTEALARATEQLADARRNHYDLPEGEQGLSLTKRACAQRGRWTWRGGRFDKDKP